MADAGTIRRTDAGTLDARRPCRRHASRDRPFAGRIGRNRRADPPPYVPRSVRRAERQDLRLRKLHPARQGRAGRPQSEDGRRSSDRAPPSAHLPRQSDHARADRQAAAEAAAMADRQERPGLPDDRRACGRSRRAAAYPALLGDAAFRNCGRCSAPATAAITAPPTSLWPTGSTACSTRTAIRSAASSNSSPAAPGEREPERPSPRPRRRQPTSTACSRSRSCAQSAAALPTRSRTRSLTPKDCFPAKAGIQSFHPTGPRPSPGNCLGA